MLKRNTQAENVKAKVNMLDRAQLELVFSMITRAVEQLLETDHGRIQRVPPTRDAAHHRYNTGPYSATIAEPVGCDGAALSRHILAIRDEMQDPALSNCCFYLNAKGLKGRTTGSSSRSMAETCSALSDALDLEAILNPAHDETSYLDVAAELLPQEGLGQISAWRWSQLSCALGYLVGGSNTAGGSWANVDVYSHMGPIGGIHGPTTKWAARDLGVFRIVAYTNAKLMHVSFAEKSRPQV